MKKADSLTSSLTSSLTGSDNRAAVKPKRADAAERTSGGQLGNGDYVDAINQLFAELELAYHNQFHKAYAQEGSVNVAKKYWLECLGIFTPDIILKAVRNVVRTQQYLPTIASMVEACEDMMSEQGLPSAHDAYVEACCAEHPKAEQTWTHPAVYLAGKSTGWFELANQSENRVFPLFEKQYRRYCQRALAGEILEIEIPQALPKKSTRKLSVEENKERMAALKKQLENI